jgi:hypothetical protein
MFVKKSVTEKYQCLPVYIVKYMLAQNMKNFQITRLSSSYSTHRTKCCNEFALRIQIYILNKITFYASLV